MEIPFPWEFQGAGEGGEVEAPVPLPALHQEFPALIFPFRTKPPQSLDGNLEVLPQKRVRK